MSSVPLQDVALQAPFWCKGARSWAHHVLFSSSMACTGLAADIEFILCQSHPDSVATVLINRSNPRGGLNNLLNLKESHKGLFGAKEVRLLLIFSTLTCCLSPKHLPELGVLVSGLWKTKTPWQAQVVCSPNISCYISAVSHTHTGRKKKL